MSKLNILVTGADGQLGMCIRSISYNYPLFNFHFKNKQTLDISDFNKFNMFLENNEIDFLINCAAFTDVKNSERKKDLAELVNHISVENIAKSCNKKKIGLIQISTDYVFDGKKSSIYNEQDKTNPINFYGHTKLKAEKKILKYNLPKSIILRTSWLYSKYEGNFVTNVIRKLSLSENIEMVDNEIGSPTNALDLANVILKIIPHLKNNNTEIYHFSNLDFCSRFEFACKINEYIGGNSEIFPTRTLKSIRPEFSALDTSKISKDFNLNICKWSDALKTSLKNYNLKPNEI